jgi:hypothetical protein
MKNIIVIHHRGEESPITRVVDATQLAEVIEAAKSSDSTAEKIEVFALTATHTRIVQWKETK